MITKTLAIALVIGIALAGAVLQMAELPPYSLLAVGAIGVTVVIALTFLAPHVTRQKSKGETVTVLEAWEAIGHDIGVNPSKWELLQSLQHMAHLVTILSEATNPAVNRVLTERIRQIQQHGYDSDHDDDHACEEIAALATYYAMPPSARFWDATSTGYGGTLGEAILPEGWTAKPWDGEEAGRIRELAKAGALIIAELERLHRAEQRAAEPAEAVH
ncbi:hypothetical protein H3221_011985 [Pseudomonas sp. LMG 31766]|uniref:Uncharacterized protein n=1 Tax=Pseudomonas chaetocerotis TaxID=2758695 RepID=A0A931CW92_9PSED|nr:hypothetical protein [Pseudomonas chaetocerotis]MBZ9665469.1 hypothetical protein [Pseudomonas chaetocerotis]